MYPDENEIRRGLSRRALRGGADAWPDIARRLEARAPAPRARILAAAAAILLLLLAVSIQRRQPRFSPAPGPERGFVVLRAESRGRPAAPIVLQPDRNTVLIVVPD